MKHALIEDASIELLELFDKVSKEARKEKLAIVPINQILYWWTRKPIVVGKSIVLAALTNKLEDVQSLLKTNSDYLYQEKPNVEKLSQKIPNFKNITILDPFAGSGNLIFPAKEMGLNCSSSDYNPVAYLIQKATLEYPSKFRNTINNDFNKISLEIINDVQEKMKNFYDENTIAYLWAWCLICPHCEQRFPLVNQMWISKKDNNKIGYKIIPDKNKDFKIQIIKNISKKDGDNFTQKQGKVLCISCKNSIDYKTMTEYIAKNKDREMIIIQTQINKRREYRVPTNEDRKKYEDAKVYLNKNLKIFEKNNLIPLDSIRATDRKESRLWRYGIKYWKDYFNERQLLFHILFLESIQKKILELENSEYTNALNVYLGLLLCKNINTNSIGCLWDPNTQTSRHALSLRQPQVIFNSAEINPFKKVSGCIEYMLKNMTRGIDLASRTTYYPDIELKSVLKNNNKTFDIILTDPPYGDDVIYAETSDFFYCWLNLCLTQSFPELPTKVPSEEDFCASWGRFGNKKLASEFFGKGLKQSFVSMNDKLKDDGLLIVFFAHSSTEMWNLFLKSVRDAKFKVVSSYSIHTEKSSNILAIGKTSFMSSIVVVCRKILQPSEAYFEDLIPQIEDKIKNMLKQIPDEKLLAIPITDLLIMVYGKVLEVSTQHTTLKSYQKDSSFEYEDLIKDARNFIMKELVKKITGKSLNVIGPRLAFYLLIKVFHKGIMGSDDAIKISQTYNVDIKDLEKDQVIIKDKDIIRLYYLNENEMDYSPDNVDKNNLYQQLCYLAYTADSRGLEKIPTILSNDNFRTEDLKQVISLLIKNYHLRRNKGESLIPQEQKELEILDTLGDTAGVKSEGTMDSYL